MKKWQISTKKKKNGPATAASNPSYCSEKTHTKLVMVFGFVQSDLFPSKWNSYLSADYLFFFPNKIFITSIILFPEDNLKPPGSVSMLPTCPAVAVARKPHSTVHFLNHLQGFREWLPCARCWASSLDTKSSRMGWCNLLSYHSWSQISSKNVNTDLTILHLVNPCCCCC